MSRKVRQKGLDIVQEDRTRSGEQKKGTQEFSLVKSITGHVEIPPEEIAAMDAVIAAHKGSVAMWVWGPNWSVKSDLSPSTGGAAIIRANHPVFPDIFHPSKMFTGVSVIKLQNVKRADGTALTIDWIYQNQTAIKEKLRKLIETSEEPEYNLWDCDKVSELSRGVKKPRIGGSSSNFAGIYHCGEKIPVGYKSDIFLVVQSGLHKASWDFIKELEQISSSSEKKTYAEVLTDHFHVNNLRLANSYHRRSILQKLGEALELEKSWDAFSDTSVIENTKYDVIRIDDNNLLYNASTKSILSNAHDSFNGWGKNCLILTENPGHGVSVMCCEEPEHLGNAPAFGSPELPDSVEKHFNRMVFPLSTGRISRETSQNIRVTPEIQAVIDKCVFPHKDPKGIGSAAVSSASTSAFDPQTYRLLNQRFINLLKSEFGLVSRWQLEPLIITLANQK